jgi:hypothetical protein
MSSDKNDKLIEIAAKLVQAFNKTVDNNLTKELADIVKTHAGIAVFIALVVAFLPLPGLAFCAAAVNTWVMYYRINSELGMSFTDNMRRSVFLGIVANISSNLLYLLAIFLLSFVFGFVKYIVVFGTIAFMVVVGLSLYFATVAAGYVYMRALYRVSR